MVNAIIGVVNQDPYHLGLLQEALEDQGYSTLFVPEGPDAHTLIKKARPDLLMLDLTSEGAGNGWHLIQELRLDLQTAKIPLLILSGDDASGSDAKAPALARHQHLELLQGPYDAGALVAKIKKMLADRPR